MVKRLLLLCVFFSALGPAAFAGPLYEELSRAGEVKVYVAPVTDPSGKSQLDVEAFRKNIASALEARKSVRFKPVEAEADARIRVEAEIKGYTFSLTDPVDMLIGVGAAAMDAATQEHFASTEVTFTVKDKSGAVKWSEVVRASITDAKMTEAEARERILERASMLFVREAFGKKK